VEGGLSFQRVRNHKSLVENIVEDLQSKIISGQLKPGQRMVEADFCRRMGISRSPLREAFRILEGQGFLVHEPRKGMCVSRVSLQEIEDIYVIRANLESLATGLAVRQQDPRVLGELKKLHGEMVKAEADGNSKAYHRLNLDFHETINSASHNQRLLELINAFSKQTERYRALIFSIPGKTSCSIKNHEELIRSFEEGDAREAERIRKEAILENIKVLREHFDEGGEINR